MPTAAGDAVASHGSVEKLVFSGALSQEIVRGPICRGPLIRSSYVLIHHYLAICLYKY